MYQRRDNICAFLKKYLSNSVAGGLAESKGKVDISFERLLQ